MSEREKSLRKARRFYSVFLICLLVGVSFAVNCAYAETVLIPVKPRDGERSDYCGEVCIQQALMHFGKNLTQKEINKAGGGNAKEGLWSEGIEVALQNLGVKHKSWRLETPVYSDYVKMIKEKLDQGYPVLAGVKINPTKHAQWFCDHFILIIGYTDDSFIYNSPTERKERTFLHFRYGDDDGSGLTLSNRFNYFFGVAIEGN